MVRLLQLFIFIPTFLAIYFSVNYYVYFRILGLLEIPKSFLHYSIFIALALSYILAVMLERFFHSIFTRSFYALASVWMGVMFFLFSTLIIYELLNPLFKFNPRTAGIIIIIFVSLISLFSIINAIQLKTNHVSLDGFGAELKVVQLSDIHAGTIKNSKYLHNLVDKVNKLNPDMIFITGDLVDGSGPLRYDSYDPLKALNAKTFFIHGNHETYEGLEPVEEIINKLNFTLLKDSVVTYKGIQIAGLNFTEDIIKMNTSLNSLIIDNSIPSILLNHAPILAKEASLKGFNLQLSGHTHNGQIFPFNLLVKMQFKYLNGLYKIDNMFLYVSPGTSTWGPPMRLGSTNEITVFNLKK